MGDRGREKRVCVYLCVRVLPDAWPLGIRVKRRNSAEAASLWAGEEEEIEEEDGALVWNATIPLHIFSLRQPARVLYGLTCPGHMEEEGM